MILETYTTKPIGSGEPELPDFLTINREITTEKDFSMYQLSRTKGSDIRQLSAAPGTICTNGITKSA